MGPLSRLRLLRDRYLVATILACTALGLGLPLLFGCAHATRICEWNDAGQLAEQYTTSTVVGTGETEIATAGCEAFVYSTKDTGISDNGVKFGGVVTEAIVRGVVAGTGVGAAGQGASAAAGAASKAAKLRAVVDKLEASGADE